RPQVDRDRYRLESRCFEAPFLRWNAWQPRARAGGDEFEERSALRARRRSLARAVAPLKPHGHVARGCAMACELLSPRTMKLYRWSILGVAFATCALTGRWLNARPFAFEPAATPENSAANPENARKSKVAGEAPRPSQPLRPVPLRSEPSS